MINEPIIYGIIKVVKTKLNLNKFISKKQIYLNK